MPAMKRCIYCSAPFRTLEDLVDHYQEKHREANEIMMRRP